MNNHTLLFISSGIQEYNGGELYNYNDGIYKNIETGKYLVIWNGQKKGGQDYLVENRDNIHIWYRKLKKTRFAYLGKVSKKLVLCHRDNDKLLQIQFTLENTNLSIPFGTMANDMGKGHSYKRYKFDCFTKLNLIPTNNYYASGIKEGSPKNSS